MKRYIVEFNPNLLSKKERRNHIKNFGDDTWLVGYFKMSSPNQIIVKRQDTKLNWYWIPENILPDFEKDRIELRLDRMIDAETWLERYGVFRTKGSPNKKPEYYKRMKYSLRPKH